MKKSKRQQEIEARRAADPIAQALGRTDIDYSTDELPTAPRGDLYPGVERQIPIEPPVAGPIAKGRIIGWATPERVVEVEKEWYAALCEYLHPVERMIKDVWSQNAERMGIVFVIPNPERSIVVFVPKETT